MIKSRPNPDSKEGPSTCRFMIRCKTAHSLVNINTGSPKSYWSHYSHPNIQRIRNRLGVAEIVELLLGRDGPGFESRSGGGFSILTF